MSSGVRQAVIVLGMHRSGTSALSGALARLGFALPHSPMAASDDNPEGFYESQKIVVINHEMLRAAGCAWNICVGFEPSQVAAQILPATHDGFYALLQAEFGATAPFVLKDPRMCMTLPAWLPALQRLAPGLALFIMVRHPAEVVQSHLVRNQLPEDETVMNWLHHMLEAERMSRGLRRAILFYPDLLQDWRSCLTQAARQARLAWPRPMEEAAAGIKAFLTPNLRHHQAAQAGALIGSPPLAPLADATWRSLRTLAANPQDAFALARLDDARMNLAVHRHAMLQNGLKVRLDE